MGRSSRTGDQRFSSKEAQNRGNCQVIDQYLLRQILQTARASYRRAEKSTALPRGSEPSLPVQVLATCYALSGYDGGGILPDLGYQQYKHGHVRVYTQNGHTHIVQQLGSSRPVGNQAQSAIWSVQTEFLVVRSSTQPPSPEDVRNRKRVKVKLVTRLLVDNLGIRPEADGRVAKRG